MRALKILGGVIFLVLIASAIAIVWGGLETNRMISKCHDNSAAEYVADYEERVSFCGTFGASSAQPLPRGQ